MKSSVKQFYDYHNSTVPAELTKWERVSDSEIQKSLSTLSKRYAVEICADTVQPGDSVQCRCRESGQIVLLYPGRNLKGTESAEKLVVGKHPNDSFSSEINDAARTLTVEVIRRREPMPVGEELFRAARLEESIHTEGDYCRWYREQTERKSKESAACQIITFWMEEMAKRSVFDIDEQEDAEWTYHRAKIVFEACLAGGIDHRIPQEGFQLLTDDEAIEKLAGRSQGSFLRYVMTRCFCEQRGFFYEERQFQEDVRRLNEEAERHQKIELMMRSDLEMCREMAYHTEMAKMMMADAIACLEKEGE